MEWQAEGIILERRPYGEHAFLFQILTSTQGRHFGIWRGSLKNALSFQLGARVKATWKARLESQVGLWLLEPLYCPYFLKILFQPVPLLGLMTLTTLCRKTLPERHAYPELYRAYCDTLQHLAAPHGVQWAMALIFFELRLLKELGYGLCLDACAVTGGQQDLTHVSPVSGKAVCSAVAAPYKNRLLPLPPFLARNDKILWENISWFHLQQAFHLTGVFLSKFLFDKIPGGVPDMRTHFISRLCKSF